MTGPWPRPTRTEPRGTFPEHPEPQRTGVLSARAAADLARANLAAWIRTHPGGGR
jgi:hypothetical protein